MTDALCALSLRSIETAAVMADEYLTGLQGDWLSVAVLIPDYLRGSERCPRSKGRYFLHRVPGGFEPVCTVHSADRALVTRWILEAFIVRLLYYENTDFIMGAQGRRSDLGDLLHMVEVEGYAGWLAYVNSSAIDCSGLAIEAMRDALESLYVEPALIPDTTAKGLGQLEGSYPYTEKVTVSQRPSRMVDPTVELQPGDLCISGEPGHTTIYLGRYLEKRGDRTPYWIWASASQKKVLVFTHDEYRRLYNGSKFEQVARWKLKSYAP